MITYHELLSIIDNSKEPSDSGYPLKYEEFFLGAVVTQEHKQEIYKCVLIYIGNKTLRFHFTNGVLDHINLIPIAFSEIEG